MDRTSRAASGALDSPTMRARRGASAVIREPSSAGRVKMGRTIFVGDVHGCRDELAALLDRTGFGRGDRLVMVGDLVVRGPDPRGTLALLREVGAVSVRGN